MRVLSVRSVRGGPSGSPPPPDRNVPQISFVWPWQKGVIKAENTSWIEELFPEVTVTNALDPSLLEAIKPALQAVYPALTWEERLSELVWRYLPHAIKVLRYYTDVSTPDRISFVYQNSSEMGFSIVNGAPVVQTSGERIALLATIIKTANSNGYRLPIPPLLAALLRQYYETSVQILEKLGV